MEFDAVKEGSSVVPSKISWCEHRNAGGTHDRDDSKWKCYGKKNLGNAGYLWV